MQTYNRMRHIHLHNMSHRMGWGMPLPLRYSYLPIKLGQVRIHYKTEQLRRWDERNKCSFGGSKQARIFMAWPFATTAKDFHHTILYPCHQVLRNSVALTNMRPTIIQKKTSRTPDNCVHVTLKSRDEIEGVRVFGTEGSEWYMLKKGGVG